MNLQTILVAGLLVAVVVAIVAGEIKNRKKGKSSCGCGCENCALSGDCHKK